MVAKDVPAQCHGQLRGHQTCKRLIDLFVRLELPITFSKAGSIIQSFGITQLSLRSVTGTVSSLCSLSSPSSENHHLFFLQSGIQNDFTKGRSSQNAKVLWRS